MSFSEILERAKRSKAGLPPERPAQKRARPAPIPPPPPPPIPLPVCAAAPAPAPVPVPVPAKRAKTSAKTSASPLSEAHVHSVLVAETETPPVLAPKPPAVLAPKPPPEAEFVVAARAKLANRLRAKKVDVCFFAPALDGSNNPHDLSAVLEAALKHPEMRAVAWIAAPPKRAVGDALDLGLVLSAQSATGVVAHLGFAERPYANAPPSAPWKALVDALSDWRASNGKPDTNPFGVAEKFRGGFNSVLAFKPRANAADAAELQSKLPAPLRTQFGKMDVATSLLRVPLAGTKSTSRAETTDASAALLDAAQCGFGVDVHALIPLYSLRKSTSDRPDSPVRTTYESISVQHMAQHGDLGKVLLNLAAASMPAAGRTGLEQRASTVKTMREVFSSLKRCIFEYSMRRMIFFDGSPSNFVVDMPGMGKAVVRVIDLDPLEYRRLHVGCDEEPSGWRPWMVERDGEDGCTDPTDPTDAVVAGATPASFPLQLQLSAGQGWRPLFLLNSLFTLSMLRHRLAAVPSLPECFWHTAVFTRQLNALLSRIRNEIPHVATIANGFGRMVPPRRLHGTGFRCADRSAAFAADDENKRVSEAFAADELAMCSAAERAEFLAAAKIVQNARWAGHLQPAMVQVTRAGRDTHAPDKLGATIVSMFQYYSLSFIINETSKLTTDVLLAEFAKPGGISNLNPATNPRVASVVAAFRNYRQHTYPFLAFFARTLVPKTMEATHAPLFVDVLLEYCNASQETLNACCVDRNGRPIVLLTAEEFLGRFCAEPRTAFCTRERIQSIFGIDKLVQGTSKFASLQ